MVGFIIQKTLAVFNVNLKCHRMGMMNACSQFWNTRE